MSSTLAVSFESLAAAVRLLISLGGGGWLHVARQDADWYNAHDDLPKAMQVRKGLLRNSKGAIRSLAISEFASQGMPKDIMASEMKGE